MIRIVLGQGASSRGYRRIIQSQLIVVRQDYHDSEGVQPSSCRVACDSIITLTCPDQRPLLLNVQLWGPWETCGIMSQVYRLEKPRFNIHL